MFSFVCFALQALDLTIVMSDATDSVIAILNALPLQVGLSATADWSRLL